jgi:hypothetical protein
MADAAPGWGPVQRVVMAIASREPLNFMHFSTTS